MGDKHDYSERLRGSQHRSNFKRFREAYRKEDERAGIVEVGESTSSYRNRLESMRSEMYHKEPEKSDTAIHALSRARALLKNGSIDQAIEAAKMYQKYDKLGFAMPLLLNRVELYEGQNHHLSSRQYTEINKLIIDNEKANNRKREKAQDTHNIASRVAASLFIFSGLASLLWQDSLSATGNVVAATGSNLDFAFLLSLGLLIIGGVLLFLGSKK